MSYIIDKKMYFVDEQVNKLCIKFAALLTIKSVLL